MTAALRLPVGDGGTVQVADAALLPVIDAALQLRDGDTIGAARSAREAIRSAGGPVAALLAAAALIDVDRPMTRWWEPATADRRCERCDLGITSSRRKRYCSENCYRVARRAYWRDRKRAERTTQRAAGKATV